MQPQRTDVQVVVGAATFFSVYDSANEKIRNKEDTIKTSL